jgi:glycosyltransferase involved in cell wall biosynthesis
MTDSAPGRTIRVITHSPPAPGISGDRIRLYHLITQLKAHGWTVRVWSLVGPAEPPGFEDALRAAGDEVVLVRRSVSRARRIARLVVDTLTRQAFQAHWFWSAGAANAASAWLGDDGSDGPILVEQLYMAPFVPPPMRHRIALDTQNHEGARIRAMAHGDGGVWRRSVARLQIGPVDRFERLVLASVGSVLAVSEAETETFERMAPGRVRLIPNGVDVRAIVPIASPPRSRDAMFLGSLGYGANLDAVRYFAKDVAPLLVASGARVTIVGSGGVAAAQQLAARSPIPMTVTGFVPDLAAVYGSHRAMVVPLRHGGGTRLKILEALAWGLPVVSTSLGAAGLGLVDGEHALIADDPPSFARALERVLDDDVLWARLAANGRALVEARFSWERIGDMADDAMRDLADRIAHPAD